MISVCLSKPCCVMRIVHRLRPFRQGPEGSFVLQGKLSSSTEFVLSKRSASRFTKTLLNTEKVAWREVCILERFCRLALCLKIKDFAIGKSRSCKNFSIEENNFCWWNFMRESKTGVEWVSKIIEVVDFGFGNGAHTKNVINVSFPNKWFMWACS